MRPDKNKETDKIADGEGELFRLIKAYREDDEAAFDRLAEMYEPLIGSMVGDCVSRSDGLLERDDVKQYALIAFSKAVLTYDMKQGSVSFGLYAKICIGNALASRVRMAKRKNVEILPMDEDAENAIAYGGDRVSIGDLSSDIIDRENVAILSELIKSTLSDFENEVFWLFAGGLSSSEIAYKLGKTEKSVDNAIFRAKNKLKAVLNGSK